MRPLFGVLLSVALMATTLGAPTHASTRRRVELRYELTDNYQDFAGPDPVPPLGAGNTSFRYEFDLKKGERYVSVTIVDDSEETVVAGVVSQWVRDGGNGSSGTSTGHSVTYERFCGHTEAPVKIKPNIPVRIKVQRGTCSQPLVSMPTSGRIIAFVSK